MFPDVPYPGYSWRLNHHMGRVTPDHLYHILWAANRFSRNADPAADINNYLIANGQWTPNVREDSGQPEGWRDYQQTLSELGLIYSLEVVPQITPTPLGFALLDGSLGFSEVITLQALRLQYPNGHHVALSPPVRRDLAGTPYSTVGTFTEVQGLAGVQIRPAVLAWRVLRGLIARGSAATLSVDEFESYLMRCAVNGDSAACTDAIASARNGGAILPRLGTRQRRNAQDWIKFLRLSSIFSATDGSPTLLTISEFGNAHSPEIDEICAALEMPGSFWRTTAVTAAERSRWYSEYGGVDLSIPELPEVEVAPEQGQHEFVGGEEEEDKRETFESTVTGGRIELRAFQGIRVPTMLPTNLTIQSVYSAELTASAHRLHDQMVLLIAQTCQARGASIFEDPDTVDLLVQHQQREFIIEVKSVTPRNFIARLRYALGQVLHYDFLRSATAEFPRRKVIAFAAQIPPQSWSVAFLNNHLDMDLITLESGRLRIHSPSQAAIELFG
ncbi:MAG: hypothetical protein WCF22_04400 [Candidatus Sulfotelmatobacter sp.]